MTVTEEGAAGLGTEPVIALGRIFLCCLWSSPHALQSSSFAGPRRQRGVTDVSACVRARAALDARQLEQLPLLAPTRTDAPAVEV